MKMTIVTDGKGKLIASMFEPADRAGPDRGRGEGIPEEQTEDVPSATLRPGPGQVFQEVDVPDDYASLSPDELHRELQEKHLPRAG
jgi:hypothetical protein